MNTKFKIYLAALAVVVVFGAVLNSVVSDEVPPTSPNTSEELQQLRQSLTATNKP